MTCNSLSTYLFFFACQLILRFVLFGLDAIDLNLLGVIPFAIIIYLLCRYKFFTVANVVVGLTILIGIYADIFTVAHFSTMKKAKQGQTAAMHELRTYNHGLRLD